ncbi:efflux RND transporter permease subunit [Brevibacillus fluminis]|nr:efflux RND transporter permease subunit [Brevibacillus fluminis]
MYLKNKQVQETAGQVDLILKEMQMPTGVTYTFGGISEQVKLCF